MADTKITGLTALTAPASGDLLPIVDVSDTSMDAAGTDKKLALDVLSNFLGLYWGTGSPEGAVTAPVGSIYRRTDGALGTTHYLKSTGSGNTGWTVVENSGRRLALAQITSSQASIGTSATDVTGLTIGPADGLTVGARPVEIRAVFPLLSQQTSTGNITLQIVEGSTSLGRCVTPAIAANGFAGGLQALARYPAGSGDKTVKIQAQTSAGTCTVMAASNYQPTIAAYEV